MYCCDCKSENGISKLAASPFALNEALRVSVSEVYPQSL
jgi:hypothetical protein